MVSYVVHDYVMVVALFPVFPRALLVAVSLQEAAAAPLVQALVVGCQKCHILTFGYTMKHFSALIQANFAMNFQI